MATLPKPRATTCVGEHTLTQGTFSLSRQVNILSTVYPNRHPNANFSQPKKFCICSLQLYLIVTLSDGFGTGMGVKVNMQAKKVEPFRYM